MCLQAVRHQRRRSYNDCRTGRYVEKYRIEPLSQGNTGNAGDSSIHSLSISLPFTGATVDCFFHSLFLSFTFRDTAVGYSFPFLSPLP